MVGEGPGHRRDMEYLLTQTGLYEHLRENRPSLRRPEPGRRARRCRCGAASPASTSLALPVELLQSDFIVSMPKLKTHHWAGMTASMKNLFGAVPGAVYGWPKNILHVHGIDNIHPRSERHDPAAPRHRRRGDRDGGGRADHGTAAAASVAWGWAAIWWRSTPPARG